MARNVQLLQCVERFKEETGQSPLVSAGLDDLPAQKNYLRRVQEMLYDEYDWPHLKIKPYIQLNAGQRYYDIPSELNYERIIEVTLWQSGTPSPVTRGIDDSHYAAHNSDEDERSSPVQAWDVVWTGTAEQIEVWPIPSDGTQKLHFIGFRKLRAFISDSDVCDLDDTAIILHAAAEVLSSQGAKNAQLVGQAAARRLRTVKSRAQGVSDRVVLRGGSGHREGRQVRIIAVS